MYSLNLPLVYGARTTWNGTGVYFLCIPAMEKKKKKKRYSRTNRINNLQKPKQFDKVKL